MALNGWHPGERQIRQRLAIPSETDLAYTWIAGEMPDQHRIFHTHNLHFLPLVTLDQLGRPWGSILAGRDGLPGFIRLHPYRPSTLVVEAKIPSEDPIINNLENAIGGDEDVLAAGIGVEWSTRRRNKLAGFIPRYPPPEMKDNVLKFDIVVNEAIGNCPKYISVRQLTPHPPAPRLKYKMLNLGDSDELPQEVVNVISEADTVFLGTTYTAAPSDLALNPSHMGMNQRGGRPGFIRVSPTDTRTVYLPDFSGNRIMTSLGNIEASKLASLTFISWVTGDILYLTGTAQNIVGEEARKIMPFQNCFTRIEVTGYIFVKDALPVRQTPGTLVQASPYSPPIRFLASEKPPPTTLSSANSKATLRKIVLHSPTLATFTWETKENFTLSAGQAAILDFTTFVGEHKYEHMNSAKPTAVNDDRIRTWTVSSFSSLPTKSFDLTIRKKEGGLVTGALFAILQKLNKLRPELLEDSTPLNLEAGLVGFGGDFVLERERTSKKQLWIAGGIGVTPFLAMLRYLSSSEVRTVEHISLVLVTREPEVLLPLISSALSSEQSAFELKLALFTRAPTDSSFQLGGSTIAPIGTRLIPSEFFKRSMVEGRDVYLCGPEGLEKDVITALGPLGVQKNDIHREGFGY